MARAPPMKRAVILAAGDGGRLGVYTRSLPKALVPVGGRPLIEYTLEALEWAGVTEAVIVVGYRAPQLRIALAERSGPLRVRFVVNPLYREGASFSLRAARAATGHEPFLLVMADHLLSTELIERLIAAERGGASLLAADRRPRPYHDVEEATRVRLDGRNGGPPAVTAIGKDVTPFDALDTGAFVIDPGAWEAIDGAPEDTDLSTLFQELVAQGTLLAADVSGTFWFDVDTADDLAMAEELVSGRPERGVA